jgi:hypothetical protein
MNKTAYKILPLLFILLLIYFGCTFLISFVPIGFADFPCSIEYNEENKCVIDYHPYIEDNSKYQIETFLTTSYVGTSGGGCHRAHSESNTLDVEISFLNLHLERIGNNLIVNGKTVEAGEKIQYTDYLHWSPWIISQIRFENVGAVTYCDSKSDSPRVIIIGNYGAEKSLGKGSILLILAIGGYILVKRKYKNVLQK